MTRGNQIWVGAILGVLTLFACIILALQTAMPAQGTGNLASQTCYTHIDAGANLAGIEAAKLDWQCNDDGATLTLRPLALRMQVDANVAGRVSMLETRVSKFDSLSIIVPNSPRNEATSTQESSGARAAVRTYMPQSLQAAEVNYRFAVPLTLPEGNADTVYVVFKGLEFPATALETQIVSKPMVFTERGLPMLMLSSMVAGFMLLPVILNLAFYRGLKQRFLLWHSALALSLLTHIAISGPIHALVTFSVRTTYIITEVSFSFIIFSTLMFLENFVQKDALPQIVRRALLACAGFVLALLIYRLGFPDFYRWHSNSIYFVGYLPVFLVLVTALAIASWRGSKEARIQVVAWIPLLLLGAIRLGVMLADSGAYFDGSEVLWAAGAFEIMVTALGVINRVMVLRSDRDEAVSNAESMTIMASMDPLTGLLNRRAIEDRFDALMQDGFHVFCLLDIDWFKGINDDFGHIKGDEVLVAVGRALSPNGDVLAVRMGGEEFMLLLRGEHACEEAERRRRAITGRVASDVQGLDRPVTLSMGMVDVPTYSYGKVNFATIYDYADKLLYEAKSSGRNRTNSGKLTVFEPRAIERRHEDRRRVS